LTAGPAFTEKLSGGLAVLLILAYALGMLFSLKTHSELFAAWSTGRTTKRRARSAWQRAVGVVRWGAGSDGLSDFRHDALPLAASCAVSLARLFVDDAIEMLTVPGPR
jgi:Ca2+/H+ antiporter